ncbi:MAG: hypothetical protein HUK26_03350 [Duodenibacillus sp.]|nr:hypothetical protein [Duodenibacillus sp.]
MAAAVLLAFAGAVALCVALSLPVYCALFAGLALFSGYALKLGFRPREVLAMALEGRRTLMIVPPVLLVIGMLTGCWRASGTIAAIVCAASELLTPALFLPGAFLMNALVSFLTGTSFGTAATMGVITMTIGSAFGVPAWLAGGAMLSGAYFGDRASPVSSSALLVAAVTGTDFNANVRTMLADGAVPALAALAAYGAAGLAVPAAPGAAVAIRPLFEQGFVMNWAAALPALLVALLALLRLRVIYILAAGVAAGALAAVFVQGMDAADLLAALWGGYRCPVPQLAPMVDGGGVTSMLPVVLILAVCSCYSGLFRGTRLLSGIRAVIDAVARRTTSFFAMACASALTVGLCCNQALPIMLMKDLAGHLRSDKRELMLDIEDSVVVIAALVPWSISCAVPLSSAGAPVGSIAAAFLVYAIVLWRLATQRERPEAVRQSDAPED